MNRKERAIITGTNDKKHGTEAKKIKWEIITVETKEHPEKPKALITGKVMYIYPTGDIAFSEITKIQLWNMEADTVKKVKIPEPYKTCEKIVIRREIIATVLYVKKQDEEQPTKPKKKKSSD